MTSIIKKIKRKRKAQTWEQSIFSRKARALRRLKMVIVAAQGQAQMAAIRSQMALSTDGTIQERLAYAESVVRAFGAVAEIAKTRLEGSKTL